MKRLLSREFLAVILPAVLIAAAAFAFALRYVKPAPPRSFVISTSVKGSPYYELAAHYQDVIAKNGVKMELRESQGSFDNLGALRSPGGEVDAGILQGGITNKDDAPGLLSMGRLLVEPVWVFYRGEERIDRLTQLKGKRILVGPAKNGTDFLSRKLLEANGITAENTTLINIPLPDYVQALSEGKADAGFLVIGGEAKTVQRLLRAPDVHLMNMAQADALMQRFSFLSRVTLRQGVVDFAANVPPEDTVLVATRAALVIREDLHPALATLLAQAVLTVQAQPTLTAGGDSRLFPLSSAALVEDDPELPSSPEARRVYKSGPTFLQRVLPFWVAALLDRALVLLLPVIGILFPLFRLVPIVYNWRMRRRILHWYKELRLLERDLQPAMSPELIEKRERDLDRIEEGVHGISVPVQFAADLYNLRDHIEFVRRRLALLK